MTDNLSKILDLLKKLAIFDYLKKNLIDFFENGNQNIDDLCPKSLIQVLNVLSFPDFKADKQSLFNFLSFETNPRVLARFVLKWQAVKVSYC